ncbi:MAG: alpha/beta fold hydrolase [Pseudomonadales bacterium]|nr:alpha/beta fold hydrolase [Pseudomonadales bacterium]
MSSAHDHPLPESEFNLPAAQVDVAKARASTKMQFAFRNKCQAKPALLLLHGWGCDSGVWAELQQGFCAHFDIYALDLPGHGVNAGITCNTVAQFCTRFLADIEPQLPARYAVLGWSLGGALAAQIAARSARVSQLITVATNPVFVARPCWPSAMPRHEFAAFSSALRKNSQHALQRFYSLQTSGDSAARQQLRLLKKMGKSGNFNWPQLSRSLHWLELQDLRECYRRLRIPVTHLFGDCDALVPVAAAEQLARDFPHHWVHRFAACAHLPFHSERERCSELILSALQVGTSAPADGLIDKPALAKAFSKAANDYERHALLQRDIGDRLYTRLKPLLAQKSRAAEAASSTIVDCGSGTGLFAKRIRRQLSGQAQVIELDLSMGMLQHSKSLPPGRDGAVAAFLQADFDALPLKPESCDAIFANFSLQWCEDFGGVLQRLSSLLKPGGEIVLSTLARGSLCELSRAWRSVDAATHVNRFAAPEALRQLASNSGLLLREFVHSKEILFFDSSAELLASVKGIGAGNHLRSRSRGLLGVQRYRKFLRALNMQRNDNGKLPLTYNVVLIHLQRAQAGS